MSRTTRMILLACVASGVLLGIAQAEDRARECPPPPPFPDGAPPPHWGGGGGFGPPPGPGGRFLKDADANQDGRVTHAEIDASIRADFDKADANHDGFLDAKEFATGMPKPPADAPRPPESARRRPPHDPAAMFGRLDWNGDGKLSPDEFALPRRAMALHADHDGDGVISEADRPDFEKGGPPPH